MASLEKDLAQYESVLGTISGSTLREWYKKVPDLDEKYTKLTSESISYRGRYCPLGYTGTNKCATPVKAHMLAIISAMAKRTFEGRYSLQECCDLLSSVGLVVTRMGLKKVFERYISALGLDAHLPSQNAKVVQIESLEDAEKLVQRERKRFAKQAKKEGWSGEEIKEKLNKNKKTAPSKTHKKTERTVESKEELESDEFKGREVVYEPTPKQTLFHAASEKIVLYGGAAGGGKSYALIFDAIRYAHVPRYRALIIRRTMPELMELIETSKEFYPRLFPGAKFNTQKNMWRFPSGAILEFGYLEKPNDKLRYQGQQYQYIAFDELGQWKDPEGWNYLKSRLRKPPIDPRTGEKIPCLMRATSNPGASWVKEMFIDAAPENTTFYDRAGVAHKFIPATLFDNPHLDDDYRQMLESLPEMERKQLLYGDWNATDKAAFPEFRPDGTFEHLPDGTKVCTCKPHVIEPFDIPKWWNRVCGMDYGYRDPATAVWYAVNPANGQKIVYREYAQAGKTGKVYGQEVLKEEREEVIPIDHVLDWSVFNKTGHTGPTVGEEIRLTGLVVRPADKNRIGGKVQIHEHLRPMANTNEPGIVFFNTCPGIIGQLRAAEIKENEPDDIDQTRVGESHKHHWDLYDSLRYGLMARPTLQNRAELYQRAKQQSRWGKVNRYFS